MTQPRRKTLTINEADRADSISVINPGADLPSRVDGGQPAFRRRDARFNGMGTR